jgi:hypothetical protein
MTLMVLLAASCAGSKHATSPVQDQAAQAAAPAQPTGTLATLAPLLGDWKRADGSELHYVFAGDAIFGVSFAGDTFEVSIVTAEPAVKTQVFKNGASETTSDGAPSAEGLTHIETPRADALDRSEANFAEATAARGVDGWLDWFDEHGGEWDPGDGAGQGKPVVGHEAIKAFMGPVLSRPNFRLEWHPIKSGLAPGGALGYTVGVYEGVMLGEGGARTVRGHGAFVTVWKRQGDGSWKVLFDTGDPAS